MRCLYQETRNDHTITIYDTLELYGEKGHFRVMQFSSTAIQGAMDLDHPERIVFEYPRAIIHLMEGNDPSFEDILVIGHGIGTIARYFSEKRVKVAELDGKVVDLSRKYFAYGKDNVMVGDGRLILEKEEPRSYDYIILDAFNDKGTPRHLTSREFFKMTKEKLDSDGAMIMNLMGKGEFDSVVQAIHSTLLEEYTYTKSFILPSEKSSSLQNIILIGKNKPIRFQARQMAGFKEIGLVGGHIITDRDANQA